MMTLRTFAMAGLVLGGCATTNDSGVRLHKKPDLSAVTPGTPVSKVAALRKPAGRNVVSTGEWKGAEVWHYEWDDPKDEVNNRMFTSVLVKDGIIMNYVEDTAEKWGKNPQLHKAAKFDSTLEDIAALKATAARYQMAAAILSGGGSRESASVGESVGFLNSATQRRSTPSGYMPLASTSPAAYGSAAGVPVAYSGQRPSITMPQTRTYRSDGFGGYRGSDGTRIRSDGLGGYRVNDGTSSTRYRSDGFGGYRSSDGARVRSDGLGGYRVNDGTSSTRYRSDGFGGYRGSDGTRVRSDGLGGYRVTQ